MSNSNVIKTSVLVKKAEGLKKKLTALKGEIAALTTFVKDKKTYFESLKQNTANDTYKKNYDMFTATANKAIAMLTNIEKTRKNAKNNQKMKKLIAEIKKNKTENKKNDEKRRKNKKIFERRLTVVAGGVAKCKGLTIKTLKPLLQLAEAADRKITAMQNVEKRRNAKDPLDNSIDDTLKISNETLSYVENHPDDIDACYSKLEELWDAMDALKKELPSDLRKILK